MPNIRRTFPGTSRSSVDEEEADIEPVVAYRPGKQFRMGGGKHLGVMRHDDDDEDEDDDSDGDSDEEEEEEAPSQQYTVSAANRGGGKQLRPSGGGGKYLRPPTAEDDDDGSEEEDSDEELEDDDEDAQLPPEPIRVMPRGGGKNLMRMRPQEEPPEEDSEEESDEEEEDDEEEAQQQRQPEEVVTAQAPPPEPAPVPAPAVAPAYRVVPRGGGKSLSRMIPDAEDDSEEDDDEEEESLASESHHSGNNAIVNASAGGDTLTSIANSVPTEIQPQFTEPATEKENLQKPITLEQQASTSEVSEEAPKDAVTQPVALSSLSKPEATQIIAPKNSKEADSKISISEKSSEKQKTVGTIVEEKKEPVRPVPSPARRGKTLRKPTKSVSNKDDDDDDDDDEEEEMEFESSSSSSNDDDEDFVEPKSKVISKSPAKKSAASKKRKIEEESDEDNLLHGDDDASNDEEEELDINNTDALVKDEKDRKHLDSLPELEREAILGERFEKLKAEQDMKRAMREAKRKKIEKATDNKTKKKDSLPVKGPPAKKGKTTKDGDEELAKQLSKSRRESARDRDATKAKSKKAAALAALKKQRNHQQQKADDSSEESSGFDDDDDDDSDDDYEETLKPWQKKSRSTKTAVSRLDDDIESEGDMNDNLPKLQKQKRSSFNEDDHRSRGGEATLEDFMKVTIPRRRLSRWCNEPFFNAAILECFVRFLIGEDDSGQKVYRLCEIVDVKTGSKTYKFPLVDKNSKPVTTNKTIRVKFGSSEKDIPMYLVSDMPPTEADVQKYITAQKNDRGEILSKRRATKLRRLQDDLVLNYTYTTEDIEKNLQARKSQGKSLANFGLEQTKMAIAVQAARDALDEAKRNLNDAKKVLITSEGGSEQLHLQENVQEAQKVHDAAERLLKEKEREEKALKEHVEDRKRRLTQRAQDMNWAKVNERALQMNQRADREANKQTKDASQSGAVKKEEFNPYARRRVKPKILWEVGQAKDEEKRAEDVTSEENLTSKIDSSDHQADAPALVHEPNEKGAALTVSESHQFAIDEEGLVQSSVTAGLGFGRSNSTSLRQRVRRGISLSEYLERKASGFT